MEFPELPTWLTIALSVLGTIILSWIADATFPLAKGAAFRFGDGLASLKARRATAFALQTLYLLARPEAALALGIRRIAQGFGIALAVIWVFAAASFSFVSPELGFWIKRVSPVAGGAFTIFLLIGLDALGRYQDPSGEALKAIEKLRRANVENEDLDRRLVEALEAYSSSEGPPSMSVRRSEVTLDAAAREG